MKLLLKLFVSLLFLTQVTTKLYCPISPTCIKPHNWTLKFPDRKHILRLHNSLRNSVASGTTNLPAASNMNELVYSRELEKYAYCGVVSCGEPYEKYKYQIFGGPDKMNRYHWEIEMHSLSSLFNVSMVHWTMKSKKLTPTILRKYFEHLESSSFTQIIWAETTFLGCTAMEYKDHFGNFVCVYKPVGNIVGQEVYSFGEPAAKCSSGRSSSYKSLCITRYSTNNTHHIVLLPLVLIVLFYQITVIF